MQDGHGGGHVMAIMQNGHGADGHVVVCQVYEAKGMTVEKLVEKVKA